MGVGRRIVLLSFFFSCLFKYQMIVTKFLSTEGRWPRCSETLCFSESQGGCEFVKLGARIVIKK